MKWKKQRVFLIIAFALLVTQVCLNVYSPVNLNNISIGSNVAFRPQHAERETLHDCDTVTGWTNLTVLDYTFSADTENMTEGVACAKVIINFGAAATAGFRTNTGLNEDVSEKDYLDVWLMTNDTISSFYFILYDSNSYNMYWSYLSSTTQPSFALYELDMANPSYEHASFNRSDIDFFAFQCNGAGFVTIWLDFISSPVWQHSYVTQSADTFYNVTLDGDTLTLSKNLDELNIECTTEDRVRIDLYSWFDGLTTQLQPYSPVSTSFDFDINVRSYGEPQGISGVSDWSFDEATTTLTFSCANASMVIIRFADLGTRQTLWYLDRMLMWLGIGGIGMMMFSPIMCVFFLKKGELSSAFVWGMMLFIIGMGLMVGWLWG